MELVDTYVCVKCGQLEFAPAKSEKRSSRLTGICKDCKDASSKDVSSSQSSGVSKGRSASS